MVPQVKLKSIVGAAVIEYSIGAVWNWLVNTCNKSSSFATQPLGLGFLLFSEKV